MEANTRKTPPRGQSRKRARRPRGALVKASMWNPSKDTRSLPVLGDQPIAGPSRDLYFWHVLDGFCVAAFATTNYVFEHFLVSQSMYFILGITTVTRSG